MTTQWVWREVKDDRCNGRNYNCSICRKSLNGSCLDCLLRPQSTKREQHKDQWFTLLLIRQRYVPLLPRDLVMDILNFAWRKTRREHKLYCPWWIVPACGHTFHFHCLERWTMKRPCCPLDSEPLFPSDAKPEHMQTEASWTKAHTQIVRLHKNV